MVSTWIEASAKGRHGGPVRAGMWSAVVVGTHPIETDQEVWLELLADDQSCGSMPAYWLENKGVNSFWHVPIPPQKVGTRLRYRSAARRAGGPTITSPYQEIVARANLPYRVDTSARAQGAEGLVGNRHMTVRVDGRGSTYDVYFPTVGLHSDVRPAEGDQPESRSHFRTIMGGLAIGSRLEWFDERHSWEVFQRYQGATNLLVTALRWRHGPIRVLATDFVATGPDLPRTAGGTDSPGQYLKRFRVLNEGDTPRRALFGLFVQAEINGGVGETGLSWHDGDRTLLAMNRGHGHSNRKLARDSTVEFALALDDRDEVSCEPSGPNEAMILRWLDLPAGEAVSVDVLVSAAFTGWRGDLGTFEHWLKPALGWFRSSDLDRVEAQAAGTWDTYVEPLPSLHFPRPVYAVTLRRSALGSLLHADAKWGAFTSGYDLGLHAYCWPRDTMFAGSALERAGHPKIGRNVFEWLMRVRAQSRPYSYWFQKYTIDGWPEWETPAVDQSAMIPWSFEQHYRRTGNLDLVASCWPMVEQAAAVCGGAGGHPGLSKLDDVSLITSAGIWDNRFGAFLYSNVSVVAGLRSACRLAEKLGRTEHVDRWQSLADEIWERGILGESKPGEPGPGMVDSVSGRFLDARRLSTRRGLWSDNPETLLNRSNAVDISLLGPAMPFGLLPARDSRLLRSMEKLLQLNTMPGDPNTLTCWASDPDSNEPGFSPGEPHQHDPSSLATLWMARYLLQLGRETGEGRHWTRAIELLNDVITRLGSLGLSLNLNTRHGSAASEMPRSSPGVWGLHAMLIETLLDIGGVDHIASEDLLLLRPVMPLEWPHVGLDVPLSVGQFSYRWQRSTGPSHRLSLSASLSKSIRLQVELTCPTLEDLAGYTAPEGVAPPKFDRKTRCLSWEIDLPRGDTDWEWSWS